MIYYDTFGYTIKDGDKGLALLWGPNYLHIHDEEDLIKTGSKKIASEEIVHRLIKILFEEKLKDHRNEPS
jgi:hypothetical protein